jgi:hypothetical protein
LTLIESVRSHAPNPTLRASYYSRKKRFFDLLVEIAMTPGNLNATANGLLAAERGRSRALMDLLAGGSVLGPLPEGMAERHANNQRQIDYLSNLLSRTPPDKDTDLRACDFKSFWMTTRHLKTSFADRLQLKSCSNRSSPLKNFNVRIFEGT